MNYPNIREHLMTYSGGAEPVFTRAEGSSFYDEAGNGYLCLNDISCILGCGHPKFSAAVARAAMTKSLVWPGSFSPEKEQLIANFMEVTHGDFDKILFSSSGGEAVDWAVKVARRHTGRDGIISFRKALHGRSFAGAWLSDTPGRKDGFGSGLEHTYFWDSPGDGRPMEPKAEDFTDIAGILLEPYQAIGGMASPSPEYWQWLRQFTRERGIVLILDEIQTGFGKTGSFFAYEQAGIVPDILLAGKGMSNGFGMGAILMTKEVSGSVLPQQMGGGSADNPFLCSVVNTVFDVIREENLLSHVTGMGNLLRRELDGLGTFRGRGLFCSLELPAGQAEKAAKEARARGIILGRSGDKLMFRPPLVITEEELLRVCGVLNAILRIAHNP